MGRYSKEQEALLALSYRVLGSTTDFTAEHARIVMAILANFERAVAPSPVPAQKQKCTTCDFVGEVDERLGGEATSGIVQCPDCGGAGLCEPAPAQKTELVPVAWRWWGYAENYKYLVWSDRKPPEHAKEIQELVRLSDAASRIEALTAEAAEERKRADAAEAEMKKLKLQHLASSKTAYDYAGPIDAAFCAECGSRHVPSYVHPEDRIQGDRTKDCEYGYGFQYDGQLAANWRRRKVADLTATVERLRAALEPFASRAEAYDPDERDGDREGWVDPPLIKEYRAARAARSSGEQLMAEARELRAGFYWCRYCETNTPRAWEIFCRSEHGAWEEAFGGGEDYLCPTDQRFRQLGYEIGPRIDPPPYQERVDEPSTDGI